MANVIRGSHDPYVDQLVEALTQYEAQHPGTEASLYRQNPGSVHVRIIDERFARMSRSRRHNEVWDFLSQRVPDDTLCEIGVLLLFPRVELRSSMANMDFEDPLPSSL